MNSQNATPYWYFGAGIVLLAFSLLTFLFSVWLALPAGVSQLGDGTATNTPSPSATLLPATSGAAPPTPASTSSRDVTVAGDKINNNVDVATSTPIPGRPLSEQTPAPASTRFDGVIVTDSGRLNLRSGPGVNYGLVSQLSTGDDVMILERTEAGDWLHIETPDKTEGWVAEQYVEYSVQLQQIPLASNLPPAPAVVAVESAQMAQIAAFDVYHGQESGQIPAYTEKWYTFFEGDQSGDIVLVVMFDPNVNLNANAFHLSIYDDQQISDGKIPANTDALANIGAGSRPGSDRDGDEGNGELIWRGGPLDRNRRYYIRLANASTSVVNYCLATQDVYEWTCPR